MSLTDLEPGTNYFYCIYITCGKTTIISQEILQFTTTANNAPELKTVSLVTEPENESISVSSQVTATGAERIDMRGFCYAEGEDQDPTLRDKMVTIDEELMSNDLQTFTAIIDGLNASTAYTVRAFAMNDAGSVGYGPIQTITTANAEKPTVRMYDDPDVRGSYALVSAEISDEGAPKGVV